MLRAKKQASQKGAKAKSLLALVPLLINSKTSILITPKACLSGNYFFRERVKLSSNTKLESGLTPFLIALFRNMPRKRMTFRKALTVMK